MQVTEYHTSVLDLRERLRESGPGKTDNLDQGLELLKTFQVITQQYDRKYCLCLPSRRAQGGSAGRKRFCSCHHLTIQPLSIDAYSEQVFNLLSSC